MAEIWLSVVPSLIFCLLLVRVIVSKKNKNSRGKLPPGSMGWPYLGETLQLYSQNPNVFFTSKQKRYGEIFKTRILGYPCVMLASPEAARFVLVTHAHMFKPTYPRSKEKLIGPSALFFHQGDYHSHIRKLVQSSLYPETIRKLIPDIEHIALSSLQSWANMHIVSTYQEMKKFAFDVGILAIFGHLECSYKEILKHNYNIVDKGYNSFPMSIPGTSYHKALMARKRLKTIVSEIIRERREKRVLQTDFLGHLLNFKDEKGRVLTQEQIADNIIGVLFAAQDTTASCLTWILKYLHDDQKLLEAVKAEQRAIYEENSREKKPLTWGQTRNMPLTHKVIVESLRMASIISFTFREAVVDVEYKGYLIPKGWKVMPLFRNIHHNPKYFSNPEVFDPSRFEVNPKPNTFMPFGSGVHACPGNELAKLQILIFLHHLTSNFRWEVKGGEKGIQYSPFPIPQDGLPATFRRHSL
ncbi:Cytochrome P450 [Arabidopsis thaliana x Arabidopsis arenosa]|uniref:(+)-abscisic acid 8'-hydroxylase n=1 Tax=Arabidopsis thaliana x Arabidopsis arenosa TaxID=1240361 RepID=A0A8T2AYM4_9BRAS|nr:Cytochrome P450 [Arabidopsis thaliana x Arabidopsis arenosa]